MTATALITGVTGQDGYYLARLLLEAGLEVHGIGGPTDTAESIDTWGVTGHHVNLTEQKAVRELVTQVAPDYVFHLAGLSSVAGSWADPVGTIELNALSTTMLLDACLALQDDTGRAVVVINASSAEVFAGSSDSPQVESTPIRPTSPYGASKALGHMMCQIYRSKGLQSSNAILYNHESPRRPTTFVTRKITSAVAEIARGERKFVTLGNLAVQRDWGWAPDYVDALFRMAKHGKGDDFVIATGVSHSIADFVAAAFSNVGITEWEAHVQSDADLMRPVDRADMVGDASKADSILGWRPTKTFDEMIAAMVQADLRQEQPS